MNTELMNSLIEDLEQAKRNYDLCYTGSMFLDLNGNISDLTADDVRKYALSRYWAGVIDTQSALLEILRTG